MSLPNPPATGGSTDPAAILPTGHFVVLRHEMPAGAGRPTHWDFMLEADAVLRTWALDHEPADGESSTALALPDHRLDYLTYEGPVSGNRGDVVRWDAGSFVLERASPMEIVVRLVGNRLAGRATLACDEADAQRWRFSFAAEPT